MRHRLSGLEAGRFVAALLVACFHFSIIFLNLKGVAVFDMAFRAGHAGVEYFFVLSGFIIFLIHAPDIGRPDRLASFVGKRVIRVYPTFWLVWGALLIALLSSASLNGHRDISGPGLLLDALLLPTDGSAVVGQSWTLRHEIVFYAVFATAILNARIGLAALVLWQVAVVIVGIAYIDTMPQVLKPFFYIYNIGFGLGMATAWLATNRGVARPGLIAAVGAAAFLACMVWEWSIGRTLPEQVLPLGNLLSPLLYLSSAALVIYGVTRMEMETPLPFQTTLKVLGGSSYVLYLLHNIVGSVVIRVFSRPALERTPDWAVFLVMVVVAVAVSVAVHLAIERPLLTRLRRAFLGERRSMWPLRSSTTTAAPPVRLIGGD